MQYEEFVDLKAWWNSREENERAWKVKAADVIKEDEEGKLLSVNLDVKNPNKKDDYEHLAPEQLVEDIMKKEKKILELLGEIREVVNNNVMA